jgi:nucleoside-diphosphate-sugar epimerase
MARLQGVAEKMTLIRADLGSPVTWKPAVAAWKPDTCIHLAWYVKHGKYLHAPQNVDCLIASLALLQELIQVGCPQVVMAGTCQEYDAAAGFLREEGPTCAETLYAACKLSLGLIGRQMAAGTSVRFAWGRIFYVYGPQEDSRRVVPAAIQALAQGRPFPATPGEQVRDYLHVEDVASAFLAMAEKGASGIVNIASCTPITVRQLLEAIGRRMGRAELIRFGEKPPNDWDPPFICGDNRRLKGLGWRPRYTLDGGIEQTIAWWREAGRAVGKPG